MAKLTSAVVWRGISMLDNKTPIVAIVTGLDGSCQNPKTGAMAQLWFMVESVDPVTAARTGLDGAVCGNCGLRGCGGKDRGCYVVLVNAPRAVWAAFHAGRYPDVAPELIALNLRESGLPLRLGAYGDPAAGPTWLLQSLTNVISGNTGYTHAWRNRPDLAPFVMASADSQRDVEHAHAMGFRTFRTRAAEQPLLPGEIACPASEEAGKRTSCEHCGLCDGSTGVSDVRRSIAIIAHGTPAVHALKFIRSIA